MPPPSFFDMVPFYKHELVFTMELKTSSSFKTTSLLQPWQTLCKIFSKCLTKLSLDGISTAIADMQMMYCFIINFMWIIEELYGKGLYYFSSASKHLLIRIKILQRYSLAEHKKSNEEQKLEKCGNGNKHWHVEEMEKMMEGSRNVIDDSLHPRNDEPNIPDTRIEPKSDKESPEVEITNDEEVEITNVVIPVNVNEEEEEITNEVYELKRREKGKIIDESRSTPFPTPIRSHRIHTDLVSSDTEKLQELTVRNQVPVYVAEGLILERQKTKEEMERMIAKAILQERGHIQADISSQIQKSIDNHIPSQVDASIKFENLQVPQTTCRPSAVRPRDQDDPHDDAHPEGENSAKRQKTSEYEAYVSGESSSGQVNEEERGPSTSGNQEQVDDYDFWTDSYASDDDEIPTKQVSQDIMEEVSLTIDEAKLKKMADEMLRQRCTSGDEHQYHIDQMKNFLKSDIVWESRKEILVSPHPRKTTPLVQSCQRDPEAPTLSLINQDLLYLKKGSSGPEKIILSLHKFPAIIFNDDDIEE
ncbi:hypothetical protein Tco_1058570 [Tanacetum coccineum]|uniref:Uncharacterized protein n=1 Tax=Tanacetum coccineum TaxID=301880 RepID=A0ABQ5H8M8_9ASTR